MALDFMCDAMIKNIIIKTESVGSKSDRVSKGYHILSVADKSRFSRPKSTAVWYLSFTKGVDVETTILNTLKKYKKAKQGKNFVTLLLKKDAPIKVSTDKWPAYYCKHKEVIDKIVSRIKEKSAGKQPSLDEDLTQE